MPVQLDNLEFRTPVAEIDKQQIFNKSIQKIGIIFSQVWQRRFKDLWLFTALQNDVGNLVKFSGLPLAPLVGQRAWVSDSTVNTWGSTAAGGGANQVGVVFNGVNWTVFAK